MRITLVSKDYPPVHNGVADYTCHLARQLAEMGGEVTVLTSPPPPGKKIASPWMAPGVEIKGVIDDWSWQGGGKIISQLAKIQPQWVVFQYVPHMYSIRGLPFSLLWLMARLRTKRYKVLTVFHEISLRLDWKNPVHTGIALAQRFLAAGVAS